MGRPDRSLPDETEVAVVGGGFAGIVAARELRRGGRAVTLLEARDRLGGRTWTSRLDGVDVELGGAYVHWFQPHLWAELTRYGLEIDPGVEAETTAWVTEGGRREAVGDQVASMLDEGMAETCGDAGALWPRPFELPLALAEPDRLSVAEAVDRASLRPETRDLLRAGFGTLSSAPLAEAGFVPTALKAYALAGYDAGVFLAENASYTIRGGTRALVEAIATDAGAEVKLSCPVDSVEQRGSEVRVTVRGGGSLRASAAVIAVPLNTWDGIRFDPPLSEPKRAVASAGQASRGAKVFVRIRGERPPFTVLAPEEHGLTLLEWAGSATGQTLLVGFGSTNEALRDRATAETVVRSLVPDAEVLDVSGHDWTADPFSRGTWCTLRPGQLTGTLEELRRREGRLVFAGGDIAAGWLGYIDGAVETGLRAAWQTAEILAG